MATVRTHLWFSNGKAGDAARFYAEHIPNSSVGTVVMAPEGMPGTEPGSEFIVEFTVAGHGVVGLNSGEEFTLDESFSFLLDVDGQAEVDHYWDLLTADGGQPGPCGWCKDKFGVSWQVVPKQLAELCGDFSTEGNRRATEAMMQMGKIDVAGLQAAHDGA